MDTSTEMMAEQMLRMDGTTLQNMCRASRKHADICRSDTFWRRKFKYDFGDLIFNEILAYNPISWKTEWINETYGKVLYLYPTAQIQFDYVTGTSSYYDHYENREEEEDMVEEDITDSIDMNEFYLVKLSLPLSDRETHYYLVYIEESVKRFLEENKNIFTPEYKIHFDGEKFKVTIYPKPNSFVIDDKMDELSDRIHQTTIDEDGVIKSILRNTYPDEFMSIESFSSKIELFYNTTGGEISREDFYNLPEHDDGDGIYRQFNIEILLHYDLTRNIKREGPVETFQGYEILDTY